MSIILKKRLCYFLAAIYLAVLPCSMAWAGKVVLLISRNLPPYEQAGEGIKEKMFEITLEKINMEGDLQKGKELLDALAPEVIIAVGSEAILAAQKAQNATPLVYTMVVEDPKLTGSTAGVLMQPKVEKQLEVIVQLLPKTKSIGVVYDMHFSGNVINQAREAAKNLGIMLVPIAVGNSQEIPGALEKITNAKVDILWSVADATVAKSESVLQMIAHAEKNKLPFFALSAYHVKAGAFAAFAIDYKDLGEQTGDVALKFLKLKGAKAAEYPRHLTLLVNVEVQKKLGIDELANVPGVKIVRE